MNLDHIFKTQVKLDQAFQNNLSKEDLLYFDKKIVIALLVELGEFANEVQDFKYWKKNKVLKRADILEEFADGIHFLTSIAYKNKVKSNIKVIKKYDNFSLQLAYTYRLFTKLLKSHSKIKIRKAYGAYLGLGLIVNINYEDILKAYQAKNQKNYDRIKNNY
ncbi:hypothetical protein FJO69_00335 [[Mycoplasma] falconis]|uniref:dUTP diphosphatase n=1 Tax=[Mycoplasma] falconis TaxID=92403 RepID=A0A501XBS7_9BACT|nr:dUTP diphosphatase [[Mycoplasma] falconis]TPE58045.1 hypothetical protein FJO69_00335 [[Mycoplasma] falconis]